MVNFLWFLFTLILSEALRPKPQDVPTASLGDFQFPTAEDGRAIPIAIGTVLVGGANVVWYGDFRKRSIKRRSGLFGGSTTVGAEYLLGFQAAICGPCDALVGMRWDKKDIDITLTDQGDHDRVTINAPGLFGGRDSEGGVAGDMDFYYGTDTQTANDYLETQFGAGAVPGYRGISYAVARQMYLGTSKYIKAPAWIVRHCPNSLGLTAGRHIIGSRSANPAAAIYYLMTDPDYGMGMSPALIDTAVFQAVGNTLHTEGIGVNFQFDQFSVAGELVEDVLRHVDGYRYTDPVTGLIGIGLVRDDYVLEDLPTIGEAEVVRVKVDEPSWADLINYITVEYTDANFRKRSIPWPNLAGITRKGEIEARTYRYHGIDSEDAARLIAARLSKRSAYPLKRVELTTNRAAWNFHEGTPFLWSGHPYDIEPRVLRVVEIDYGTLESGEITIVATEDIFSIDQLAYGAPATDFTDPASDAAELTQAQLLEVPYQLQAGSEDINVAVVAARSNGSISGAQIWADRAGGTAYAQTGDLTIFAAVGQLTADYDPGMGIDAVGFTLDNGVDLEDLESVTEAQFQRGEQLVLIDSELMAFRDVTNNGDGTFTLSRVIRGVLDTVPRPHAENAVAYILNGITLADSEALAAAGGFTAKLLPFTDRSILELADVSALSITTASRASRAYPPGNVRVNGDVDPAEVTTDAAITWSHRNRATQLAGDTVVQQDVSSGYSAEGDYLLEFWIDGALRSSANTTGETYTYTEAQRTTDFPGDLYAEVEVRIYGRNADLTTQSTQYQRLQFTMFAAS